MHDPAAPTPTSAAVPDAVARAVRQYVGADGPLRDRVRATSQLVAGILHEFNTPLGALRSAIDTARGALGRLARAIDEDPARARRLALQLDDVLAVARDATDRIVDSVATLAHFARIDRADADEADLAQMIDTALRLSGTARSRSLTVVRRVPQGLRACCRIREVEHVLYHLLRNAHEALAGRADARIEVTARRDADGRIAVVVEDNGPGIDPAELPTLFEPVLTTKGSTVGLGLSLATCRHVAQEHGGSLHAENVLGSGARFTFSFRETELV